MLGTAGIGRTTMCKIATFLLSMASFEIEVQNSLKESSWKEDVRKLIKQAGGK